MYKGKSRPFFRGGTFRVIKQLNGTRDTSQTKKSKRPRVEIDNDATFLSVRLARAGYFGGDPDKVLKAPVGTILSIIEYETFENDYEKEYRELNKESENVS